MGLDGAKIATAQGNDGKEQYKLYRLAQKLYCDIPPNSLAPPVPEFPVPDSPCPRLPLSLTLPPYPRYSLSPSVSDAACLSLILPASLSLILTVSLSLMLSACP